MIYILLSYLLAPVIYLITALRSRPMLNPRVLIIQTAKIGDLICSSPLFREIKKAYPHASLTVMLNPVTEELIKNNPYIDAAVVIKEADYRGLSGKIRLSALIYKGKYDISICLNPNIPFAIASFWGLVPVRLSVISDFAGLTFKMTSKLFTHLERHTGGRLITETYIRMLSAVGIKTDNISKEAYKSADADYKTGLVLGDKDRPLIGVAVSSGNKLKELGSEKISEIIDRLLNSFDVYIVLIGSADEKQTAAAVINSSTNKEKIIDATGCLALSELPALLERLSLYIGVDTGITYMADAVNIPIVHIAGPIDTSEQRPAGKNVKVIQHELPCVPCTFVLKAAYTCKDGTRRCIKVVTAGEVLKASEELLEGIVQLKK